MMKTVITLTLLFLFNRGVAQLQYLVSEAGNPTVIGFSTDTKPDPQTDNWKFFELNTGKTYKSLSGSWVLQADPLTIADTGTIFSPFLRTSVAASTYQLAGNYLTGITGLQVTNALAFIPYNATNPDSYITGITGGNVTTALGFTPANNSHTHAQSDITNLTTDISAKAPLNSPTLTTPVIGVATGTSLTTTGLIKSTGTAGIGYAAGAGGTVTQATNKATGVTLNKISWQITMNGAALAAAAEVAFVLTNSTIASTDVVIVNMQSVGTAAAYVISIGAVANGSCTIVVGNTSAGSLSQAIVLNFAVIKSVTN